MERLCHPFRRLGFCAIALWLAATFGFSIASLSMVDRVTRQQQRSRVQRHPRHRMCPGLSNDSSTLHTAFLKHVQPADAPPGKILDVARPAFTELGLVFPLPQAPPGRFPLLLSSLPRPPPFLA
ncbi:MAG TPA: hypothetical protein VFQ91_03505 [Bryobacteraceae bacterium]|nr:hypothetical protein [Bryobacteraceae bacterium]